MSGRVQLVLTGAEIRRKAIRWIQGTPDGTRVEFKAPQRTPEQNDRMWAMLTDIVTQHARFNGTDGRKYTTNEAKVVFLHACGKEVQILPSLDGKTFVPYGQSSSDLSVAEMHDLIEFMFAWGAENGIVWSDPKEKALRELEARSAPAEMETA
ncbi:recombination protein NinB [Bradyrhizobium sp. WSM 1738]|uniref:recombination protein NinB n=1 Tax=Bradyrhizobium hereditatis TaxID=2821405 RepID=UPI001CE2A92A|nr:recombination protein NinB [Bradyrhizobium hereditatis]MCA6114290.1 recombination protein NinB [Bradyrhizobium hereditatis]